jgi:hypothetical protein
MNTSTFCEVGEPAQDHLACIDLTPQFTRRIDFPSARPSRTCGCCTTPTLHDAELAQLFLSK